MANLKHLRILKHGVKVWNAWREEHPRGRPNLRDANLSGANLEEADLSRMNLSGANLFGANLYGAYLTGAYLTGADLTGADLTGANLTGADLTGADLTGANLTGADLTGAKIDDKTVLDDKWRLVWEIVNQGGAGRNLTGVNLYGADLTGADLTGANLYGADLTGANLKGADLRGADLKEASLEGAELAGAYLHGSKIDENTKLDEKWRSVWEIVTQGAARRDLSGADLYRANLEGADLREAILDRADLISANLSRANLSGASLKGADLKEANLEGANLEGADLRNTIWADFEGRSVNLARARLQGTRFTPKGEGALEAGFLELATADGLDSADFGDPAFLHTYLTDAFYYVHQSGLEEAKKFPKFVEKALENIKLLRALFQTQDEPPPSALVAVVQTITTELVKYLKTHPKELYQLKPRQFEELIAEILASFGWQVQLTPASKDGGYDIYAISTDRLAGVETSWIIECKKYSETNKVGVDIARALYGANALVGAANMMLATTSHFTRGVYALKASDWNLELKDYGGILEWINTYRPNPEGKLYIKDNRLILPGEE